MERAAPGSLEARVLRILWQADRPLPGREVWQRVSAGLPSPARTTVLTVLARLEAKGQVTRSSSGGYAPVRTEASAAANRMQQLLAHADDREAALAQFAGMLPYDDLLALTRAVQQRPRP